MNLIGFHRVLIASAIFFCAFFAGWQGWRWSQGGSTGELVLAIVFAGLAASLGWYLAHLRRFLGGSSS